MSAEILTFRPRPAQAAAVEPSPLDAALRALLEPATDASTGQPGAAIDALEAAAALQALLVRARLDDEDTITTLAHLEFAAARLDAACRDEAAALIGYPDPACMEFAAVSGARWLVVSMMNRLLGVEREEEIA